MMHNELKESKGTKRLEKIKDILFWPIDIMIAQDNSAKLRVQKISMKLRKDLIDVGISVKERRS